MAIIDDIRGASYAGVPFLASITEMTGGRKDVLHSFPNSDKQQIEDLGLRLRNYFLTAIINETSRIPYMIKRDQLLKVLESGNAADLIHPFYGLVNNIVVRGFTTREELTSLGDGKIDIDFAVSDTTGLSIRALFGFSVSVLGSTRLNIARNVVVAIGDRFIVRGSDGGNISDAQSTLGRFVSIIKRGIVASPVVTNLLDAFVRKLTSFEDSIPSLILNSDELGNQISIIITDYAGIYSDALDKVGAMEDLFNFGIDDVAFALDTTALIQRQTNRDVINDSINSLALSESYVSSSQIAFSNRSEIKELEDKLERQYMFIVT